MYGKKNLWHLNGISERMKEKESVCVKQCVLKCLNTSNSVYADTFTDARTSTIYLLLIHTHLWHKHTENFNQKCRFPKLYVPMEVVVIVVVAVVDDSM